LQTGGALLGALALLAVTGCGQHGGAGAIGARGTPSHSVAMTSPQPTPSREPKSVGRTAASVRPCRWRTSQSAFVGARVPRGTTPHYWKSATSAQRGAFCPATHSECDCLQTATTARHREARWVLRREFPVQPTHEHGRDDDLGDRDRHLPQRPTHGRSARTLLPPRKRRAERRRAQRIDTMHTRPSTWAVVRSQRSSDDGSEPVPHPLICMSEP
jgi:hypothetical protein